jgi:hypothetical protein
VDLLASGIRGANGALADGRRNSTLHFAGYKRNLWKRIARRFSGVSSLEFRTGNILKTEDLPRAELLLTKVY